MRPATAVSKKSQLSARSIWKKYESIKPQKNQFYCFKTISQILDTHQSKNLKDDKKEIYYQKISSPRKKPKQNHSFKQGTQKKFSTIIDRNPTMKKALTNNFFSNKQIGKENTQYNSTFKIKTQSKIDNEKNFRPYRQQSMSIIKHSKILNQIETVSKDNAIQNKNSANMIKRDDKATQRKTKINKKEKTHYNSEISQDFRKYSTDMRRQDNQFVIEQWQGFEQDFGTFSILMNNTNKLY